MSEQYNFEKDIDVPSKQMIIDGCNVSGCAYIIPPRKQCPNKPMPYAKETSCFACKEHNTKLNFCKNNPNCYYKQLKRTESELACKEQELTHFKKENERLLQIIVQSQAEIIQKNIDEKNILLMKENMDLQQQLKAKEQECEKLVSKGNQLDKKCKQQSWDIGNLGYKIKNQRHEINNRLKQLDQLKAEQNKIKTICDNHFDEYEMGCLDLSDAIESLLERYDNAITGLVQKRNQLKAENEELKKIIKRLDVPKHEVIDMDIALENEKLKAENEDLKKSILQACPNCGEEYLNYKGVELYYENNDLKQTLTEIKEITEKCRSSLYGYDQERYPKQILQKINECEVKNDMEN